MNDHLFTRRSLFPRLPENRLRLHVQTPKATPEVRAQWYGAPPTPPAAPRPRGGPQLL